MTGTYCGHDSSGSMCRIAGVYMCQCWGLLKKGKQDQTKYKKSLDSIQKDFENWKHLHKITGLDVG